MNERPHTVAIGAFIVGALLIAIILGIFLLDSGFGRDRETVIMVFDSSVKGLNVGAPVALRGHTRDPVPISVIDGPTGPLEREAAFDEFIDGGVPQATVHEWIRQWLDLRPGRSAG